MGLDTFEREEELRRKAAKKGLEMRLEPGKEKRQWRISRAGTMAQGLSLDEVERLLEEG